jgi:hypothetical protein
MESRVSRGEARCSKRFVKMIRGSAQNWIAVKQSNLNQKQEKEIVL